MNEDNVTNGEEIDFAQWVEDTFDTRTIRNPYNEDSVLVIATCGNRAVIGGLMEMDDGMVPVYQPMMFAEVPVDIDPQTKQIRAIGPQFSKHFMVLSPLNWMMMRLDSIYFMQSNRPADVALAGEYEKAVKAVMAMDSDIQIVEEMPGELRPENVRPLGR